MEDNLSFYNIVLCLLFITAFFSCKKEVSSAKKIITKTEIKAYKKHNYRCLDLELTIPKVLTDTAHYVSCIVNGKQLRGEFKYYFATNTTKDNTLSIYLYSDSNIKKGLYSNKSEKQFVFFLKERFKSAKYKLIDYKIYNKEDTDLHYYGIYQDELNSNDKRLFYEKVIDKKNYHIDFNTLNGNTALLDSVRIMVEELEYNPNSILPLLCYENYKEILE